MRKLKLFSVLMCLFIGIGQVWGAKDDVIYCFDGSVVSPTNQTAYANGGGSNTATELSTTGTTTLSTASWKYTWGIKSTSSDPKGFWLGTNNGSKANLILGTTITECAGIATAIGKTTSETYAAALICTTAMTNVGKIVVSYGTGGTAPTIDILYSTNNGTSWASVGTPSPAGTYTFTTIASAKYALVAYGSAWFNLRAPVITFYEVSTGSSDPTISADPEDATYGVGDAATALSVTAAPHTSGKTLSYKWYSNSSESTDGATQVGTNETYTPSTAAVCTTYYYCVVSEQDGGSATSGFATIQVKAKHNIIFNNGNVKDIANVAVTEDATYSTLPTIENSLIASCTYKKFEGWTLSSSIADASVKPALVSSVTMSTADVNLYAVYSKTVANSGPSGNTSISYSTLDLGSYADGEDKGDYSWDFTQLMKGTNNTIQGNSSKASILWNTGEFPAAISKVELEVGATCGASNTAALSFGSSEKPTSADIALGSGTDYSISTTGTLEITDDIPANSTYMSLSWTSGASYYTSVTVYWGGDTKTYSLDAGCAAAGQCFAPTFSPAADTYDAAQSVELATTTDGATIYYTTNGNDPEPGEEGTIEYTAAISVTQNTTIKAIAIKGGMTDSEVSTGEFKIRFATAPTFSPAEGDFTTAQNVTMTATGADHIYYTMTSDGSTPADPTIESPEYTTAIPLNANGTYKFKAIAVKAGFAPSNVESATYTVNLPYGSIAEFIAGAPTAAAKDLVLENADNCVITGIRAYKNYSDQDRWDIYAQDASGKGIMIYNLSSLPTNAAVNHQITGTINAKYSLFKNQHEMTEANFENATISADEVSRPAASEYATLEAAYAAKPMMLVTLTNVTYDDTEYVFEGNKIYNTFGALTGKTMPETTVSCNITGIVIDYDGTLELLPVFATDIVADADAEAPVFTPEGGATEGAAVQVDLNSYVTIAAADANHSVDKSSVQITTTTAMSVTATSSRDFYRDNTVTKWYYGNSASASYDINGQGSTTEGTIVAQVNSVDAPSAKENDEVHILITPNTHFALNTITVNGSAPTEVSAGTEYQFDMPAEAVTIAVTWNEDAKVNVQFAKGKEAAEGTVPSTMSGKYENDVITLPTNPFTLASWKFKGWKHSLTNAIHQPGSYTITAADAAEDAITFAAEWEAMPDFEHGDWTLVTDVAELTEGSYVIIAAAGYDYAMKPWVSNANHCVRKAATKDGEFLTYDSEFAIFEVKNYVVAEEVVGKSFLNVNSAKYLCYSSGLKEQAAQADASAWTLSFDGSNVFHAYNKNATTYEIQYNNNNGTERFACYTGSQKAIALYKYHTPSLKLTYDKNAGEDAVTGMPSMGIADGDNKVTISDATPLREGYLFDGWNSNPLGGGTVYEANHEYTLTANLTIYAQWQTATAHPLSYDKDGGEGDVPAAADYYPNVNVTLANAVTKAGYIFAGWEYDGDIYAAGTQFTMPNNAVVMKAKYATGAVYTVASVSTVSAQGAPEGSNATFENTYEGSSAYQITGTNSMTLTLTGYDLYTIKAITLRMKSNANSGSGTLSVTIGGNAVSFTTNKWYNGTYKSGSYEDIKATLTPTRVQVGETIQIVISASANSLYCQSFAIEYERVLDDIRTGLNDGKWGTICPKQEVKYPTGAAFYQLTYMEQNPDNSPYKFFFDEIAEGASLEAGKPYLFIAEGEVIKGIKVGAEATDGDHAYNGFVGYLGTSNKALASDAYTFTDGGYNYYGLQNNIFKLIGSGQMLNERAYVEVSPDRAPSTTPVPMPAYSRRRLVVGAGAPQVTTGMDELNASEAPVKVMIDGKFYILRGEKMYDATGRLVK